MKEALYYKKSSEKAVYCLLCPHGCFIRPSKYGICRVRKNNDGILYSENYGQIAAIHADPVEKKPLYHFYPGRKILSVGTNGCNLRCMFCQNWEISQIHVHTREITPDELVQHALKDSDNIGIAYTYSEPTVWFEFVLETARKARENGLKNILVTNGFIHQEPLLELLQYVDAMNIDLKSFTGEFYRTMCGGKLEPVLETIKTATAQCHVELTNLIIPNRNDFVEDIEEMTAWIAEISSDIPLHFSRYHTDYQCKEPSTPVQTILHACEIARKRLKYVFAGNVHAPERSHTFCPKCGNILIERSGFTAECKTQSGKCVKCGYQLHVEGIS